MAQEQKIGVTYIGRRESHTDHNYGTGLYFAQGETHFLPQAVAGQFLRHPEFARSDKPAPKEGAKSAAQEALDAAKLAQQQREQEQNRIQDVRDSIARMDKDAVLAFVQTNYRQSLAKNAKLETLQSKAIELIDQYGVS